jgi:hypothetical protein
VWVRTQDYLQAKAQMNEKIKAIAKILCTIGVDPIPSFCGSRNPEVFPGFPLLPENTRSRVHREVEISVSGGGERGGSRESFWGLGLFMAQTPGVALLNVSGR